MAYFDAAKAIFTQVDTNRGGRIDRNEFQNWTANAGGLTSPLSLNGRVLNDNPVGRTQGSPYGASPHSASKSSISLNTPYATIATATPSNSVSSGDTVETNSDQQTNTYLSKSAGHIYADPNPQILRRANSDAPVTYQQKILVRFLQPPALPPPGPLIIKEVRPPQPPPPPPLIVRQHAQPLPPPPPLILRERPPVPPAAVASQTVIRRLPAVPIPPRSVIMECLPPLPPKPRDIIIERWVPYGPQAKRRMVVQRAPPPVQYPKPRNFIVVYDNVQTRVVRQFQRLGVVQENPEAYAARYGASLLDVAVVVQQARNAGVVEDISPPAMSSSTAQLNFSASPYGNIAATTAATSPFSNTPGFEGLQVIDDAEPSTFGLRGTHINAGNINHHRQLDQAEFQRFIQGAF